jgi:hypothetical protein
LTVLRHGVHPDTCAWPQPADAMNRIQNHKEGGIGSVYDRHQYAEEN